MFNIIPGYLGEINSLTGLLSKPKSSGAAADIVSGLDLHYLGSAGVFQDPTKTSPATANGEDVQAWESQVGSNDATEGITPPTLNTTSPQSVVFDGVEDRLGMTTAVTIGGTASTWSLWFKSSLSGGGSGPVISSGVTATVNISATNSTTINVTTNNALENDNFTVGTISTTEWNLLVITREGDTTRVYLNNAESSTGAVSQSADLAFDQIGQDSVGLNFFNGQIADLRVYSRVLSATDLTALFNQTGPNM